MGQLFSGVRSGFLDALHARDWEGIKSYAANGGLRDEELELLTNTYHSNKPSFPTNRFREILQRCPTDKTQAVLVKTVEQGLWRPVGGLLERGVSTNLRRWAVVQAKERAGAEDLASILPYCTDDQYDSVLAFAVEQGIWEAVAKLLMRQNEGWIWNSGSRASNEQRRQALGEAIRRAGGSNLHAILLTCAEHQELRDDCLKPAVIRGMWDVASKILKMKLAASADKSGFLRLMMLGCSRAHLSNGLSSLDRWAVQEVGRRADEDAFIEYFFPFCKDELVEPVLAELVRRTFWRAATVLLLQNNPTDAAENLPATVGGTSTPLQDPSATPQSYDDQFDFILKEAVRRGMWRVVKELDQRGFSDAQLAWVNEQATKSAGMFGLQLDTSRHGPKDQLQSLLALLDTSP
nr:hypothetical protein BaRGS_017984 [Batillaria attramentaria]